jgi:hypothetical protein
MISQYLINANIEKFIRLMSCPPARQNDERQKGEKIVEWMWGVGCGQWALGNPQRTTQRTIS